MALFSRRNQSGDSFSGKGERGARNETLEHLTEFAHSRVGVEAYIEPPTNEMQTTLLLVATTGEWTRRRVPDQRAARRVAEDLGLPVYDVNFAGYPQRMRDWDRQQRGK